MTVNIVVDGKPLEVKEGVSLLQACLDNNIYVPHLCFLPEADRAQASCRLCFVDIQGRRQPVTACTETVAEGMIATTDTPAVRRLQKSALQLLLSVHDVDCKNCRANRRCELQNIARFLKVKLKSARYPIRLKEPALDTRHPYLNYYPNRCVLCGKCVHVCRTTHVPHQQLLTFARRGFETVIAVFHPSDAVIDTCADCRQCIEICPVGALAPKTESDSVNGE